LNQAVNLSSIGDSLMMAQDCALDSLHLQLREAAVSKWLRRSLWVNQTHWSDSVKDEVRRFLSRVMAFFADLGSRNLWRPSAYPAKLSMLPKGCPTPHRNMGPGNGYGRELPHGNPSINPSVLGRPFFPLTTGVRFVSPSSRIEGVFLASEADSKRHWPPRLRRRGFHRDSKQPFR
jgi:hypothetical protein